MSGRRPAEGRHTGWTSTLKQQQQLAPAGASFRHNQDVGKPTAAVAKLPLLHSCLASSRSSRAHSSSRAAGGPTSGGGARNDAHKQSREQPEDHQTLWPAPQPRHLPLHKIALPPCLILCCCLCCCAPAVAAGLATAGAAAAGAVLAAAAAGTAAALAAGRHAQADVPSAIAGCRCASSLNARVRGRGQFAGGGSWCRWRRRHGAAGRLGP